jgi:hypothetical protein
MFPTQDKIGSIKREDGDFKPSYDRLYSTIPSLSLLHTGMSKLNKQDLKIIVEIKSQDRMNE